MPNIGPLEIIVVIIILLVIFGPKRIPELGRSVGQGMRNFKQSVTGKERDDEPRELEAERRPAEPARTHADAARSEPVRTEGPYDAEPVAASARSGPPAEGATTAGAASPQPTPDRTREPGL